MSRLSGLVEALGSRVLDYFRFQEAAGAATAASTASARTLTRYGATFGSASIIPTDPGGKSCLFDGVDDYFVGALDNSYQIANLGIAVCYEVPDPVPTSGQGLLWALWPKGSHADGRGVWARIDWGASQRLHIFKGTAGGTWIDHQSDLALGAAWQMIWIAELGTNGDVYYEPLISHGYNAWPDVQPAAQLAPAGANSTAISWADNGSSASPPAARMWVGAGWSGSGGDDVAGGFWLKGRVAELLLYDAGAIPAVSLAHKSTLHDAASDHLAPSQRVALRSCPFTAQSTWTVPLDALTLQDDDYVIVTLSVHDPLGSAVAAPSSTPSGWDLLGTPQTVTTVHHSAQYVRQIDGGSIPTEVQFDFPSAQTGVALVHVYRGIAGTPTATGAAQGSTSSPNPPSHTAPYHANHLWLAMITGTNETSASQTPPTGYGGRVTSIRQRWTTNPHATVAHKVAVAQTEDPGTWARPAFEFSVAWTIALPLAVDPTPGPFTTPTAAGGTLNFANTVSLAWGASGASPTYELQYSRGMGTAAHSTWTNIASGIAAANYSGWTAPYPGYYTFRVRSVVGGVPSAWVYSDEIAILRTVVGGTELTLTQHAIDAGAEDGWNLEELTGDFLTAIPTGYNATPGTVGEELAGNGIAERGVPALCKGIRCNGPRTALFFQSQRGEVPLYVNNYAFEQWVKPLEPAAGELANLSSVMWACGPWSDAIYPGDYDALFAIGGPYHPSYGGGFAYGAGLYICADKIDVRLYSGSWWKGTDAPNDCTRYISPTLLSAALHHIAVEVELSMVALINTFIIRLFLDGEWCGDLPGTYVEWSAAAGSEIAPGQAPLTYIASRASYGNLNQIESSDTFGKCARCVLDAVYWYPFRTRGRDTGFWQERYRAGRATLDATPAGPFTSPAAGAQYLPGSTVHVAW